MNSLISINRKFMDIDCKKLCEIIKQSKHTKGFEIYIDTNDEFENNYLDELVQSCKDSNLILQIHGEIEISMEQQLNFINNLYKYSDILGYPIMLTLHSIYDIDPNISLDKTKEYLNILLNTIDNSKIVIGLENLNYYDGQERLGKNAIEDTIINTNNLFFTYDIGHEIYDQGNIIDLDSKTINKIKNIHIHTTNENNEDHQPIIENCHYYNEVIKGINFLKDIKYEGNIVFEYDVYSCDGNNLNEQINSYLNSIDYVSEIIKEN